MSVLYVNQIHCSPEKLLSFSNNKTKFAALKWEIKTKAKKKIDGNRNVNIYLNWQPTNGED